MTIVEFRAGRLEIATFAERPELRAGVFGAEIQSAVPGGGDLLYPLEKPKRCGRAIGISSNRHQREDGVSAKPAVNAMRLACHLRGDRE